MYIAKVRKKQERRERFVVIRRTSLWVKEHPLITYFVLTYVISWIIVAPLIASAQGFIDVPVPFPLHYLNDYGPLLAALITAGIANGTEGLRELFQRMTKWRVGLGWYWSPPFHRWRCTRSR